MIIIIAHLTAVKNQVSSCRLKGIKDVAVTRSDEELKGIYQIVHTNPEMIVGTII